MISTVPRQAISGVDMTISLCMIVKNEADVLRRALGNFGAFADEIIVTDTGSNDGTERIASELGATVFDFQWIDDFSAARNFCISKASGDYYMWLDADDVVPESTASAIARLKRTLDPSVDIVMLPYVLSRDERGKPLFSYYRERIVKNRPDFYFKGRVHEAVPLHGNIVRLPHEIEHAKPKTRMGGSRNLEIYKKMLADGAKLEPRERYYYARELFYNGYFSDASDEFERFLHCGNGYLPNKIDACVMLSRCHRERGDTVKALSALYGSFVYGLPTGEACCELGYVYFSSGDYKSAAYWFERATHSKPDKDSGAFVDTDCYGFLPYVWLTVCYDRLGQPRAAYYYHCRARRIKPNHPSVTANQKYFSSLGFSAE